ncbi:hypothetical protein Tco_1338366 [Tanacetum coccineum]
MSQRRLLASLQAPFLKEKKGVRFSALYLQQKRNLLVLDHSHQQVSYFFHARSVVKWINVDQLIRKGNLLLDLQKLQKNPIFRISVDIRQNTNFVRAFTTSANVPSIYIQLFWNTLTHDVKTGVYSFQVNKHWLTLSDDLLQKALNVTPGVSTHPFESPTAGKMDITFTRRRRRIIASQDETTGPSVHPEDATSTKMVRETLSHADAESGGNSEKINSETDTEILNVGSNSEQSHVALVGPNPEHMHDVFLATNYPKVHESLKHTTKEHVHLENPPSSSRSHGYCANQFRTYAFFDDSVTSVQASVQISRWIIPSQDETTGPSVHPEDATSQSDGSHVALAGSNPEHMHDVFLCTNYLRLQLGSHLKERLSSYRQLFLTTVPIGKCNRVLERQKKLRNQIFRDLTASVDVPSSVTVTTDTTSTLPPPPPPPLQKSTGHRDIWEKVKDHKSRMHH